jgi:hypothetical protein
MDAGAQTLVQRLVETVPDPSAKAQLRNLLGLALQTLQELSSIDESISSSMAFFKNDLGAAIELLLPEINSGPLQKVHLFISYLISQGLLEKHSRPFLAERGLADGNDEGFDFDIDDLDFGDFAAGADENERQSASDPLIEVDELDIDAAFESIASEQEVSSQKKLDEMRKEVKLLAAALREQLESNERMIKEAYATRKYDVILREIDMGRDSLTEGLFAIVNTIFDIFIGECDRAQLLPGYTDALQKSLIIRRGLADLTATIHRANSDVQDEELPAAVRLDAVVEIRDALTRFTENTSFRVMRWLDRLEIQDILRQLTQKGFNEVVIACEGLTRYLESLSVVNQREVLLQHDQGIIDGIHQSLDSVRSLVEVSMAAACPMALEAVENAKLLYGRNPILDIRIREWNVLPPQLDTPEDLHQLVNDLEELL